MNSTLTERQKEYIKRNLQAFTANFGQVKIVKIPHCGFEVYYPANSENYLFFGEKIETIDGWLYGAVQAKHRIMPIAPQDTEF